MAEAGLLGDKNLVFWHHNFMAVYLLTEIYRKREDPNYKSPFSEYLDILPSDMDDFPACYSAEELSLLEGSEVKLFIETRI